MCGFMRRAPIPIQLVLVPYDTARRHWAMGAGPAHLLNRSLVEELEAQGHEVAVTVVDAPADDLAEVRTAFALMTPIAATVRKARQIGRFPLVLAGNCNTAVGTVAGLDFADSTGVFWFDAHGDFNTPDTTPSGTLDGMALAMLTGRCWRALCRAFQGSCQCATMRHVSLARAISIRWRLRRFRDSEVWRVGAGDAVARLSVVAREVAARAAAAYLHIDLDVLDPGVGRVNRYRCARRSHGGRARCLDRNIIETLPVQAAAITAYDPAFDADGAIQRVAVRVVRAILR